MSKKFRITVDGQLYNVTVEDDLDTSHSSVLTKGETVVSIPTATPSMVSPATTTTSAQSIAAQTVLPAGTGTIPSPLGGVIKEIKITVGQRINAGDIIAVLEAMKMNTNVFSNLSGKVTTIHVKVGDTVDSGQTLVSVG